MNKYIGYLYLLFFVFLPGISNSVHAQSLTADPGTIYFGDMSIYQAGITRELRIENTGNSSIQLHTLEITGRDAAQFSVVFGEIGDAIAPQSSALFQIQATPTPFPTRYMEAQIKVTSDDNHLTIALHATAREPGTYYVSPAGDDGNPGSKAQPWRTIQLASGRAAPGDTLFVEDGLYEGPVTLARSGEADAYITLKSINRWGAKIQVLDAEGPQDGIKVAANYITVDGFEIFDPAPQEGHTGNGITIYQSHHVNVLNNKVYDFGASGIQGAYCDHVLIENNVVFDNAKYNPTQSSGISVWQPWAVDDAPGYHIIIRNNRSFGNTTITKNAGGRNTDGTGIILDRFWESKDGQWYPHRSLIENNLVYDNGGSGIHIYKSSYIDVFNNTAYHNRHNEGITGSWRGELYNNRSSDTVWRNNIAYANPGEGVLEHNRAIFANRAEDAVYENNITYSTDINNTYSLNLINSDLTNDDLLDNNLVGVNPRFRDAANHDFSLNPNSHAIDAGSSDIVTFTDINYLTRTQGPIDIGAFEYFDETLDVELTSFEAQVADQDIQLRWITASELNSAGFAVEVRAPERDFEQARFIGGHGTTNSNRIYETTLQDVDPGAYALRLKKVGIDGTFEYSETIEAIVDTQLPVELTSFEALVSGEDIHLRWTTASELNNAGFSVELQTRDREFEQVLYVEGSGTSNEAQSYETTLQDLAPGTYSLRLKQIDFDGSFEYSEIIEITIGAPEYYLAQSYPNPFNPQALIPYTLPVTSHVRLEVFDLLGRSVRVLVDEEQSAGSYSARFDALDLSNGTYVYRLTAGGFSESRRMVLVK